MKCMLIKRVMNFRHVSMVLLVFLVATGSIHYYYCSELGYQHHHHH